MDGGFEKYRGIIETYWYAKNCISREEKAKVTPCSFAFFVFKTGFIYISKIHLVYKEKISKWSSHKERKMLARKLSLGQIQLGSAS